MSLGDFYAQNGGAPEQPPIFSVENSNNPNFYPYLKILSYQSVGIDIHVTFVKNRTAHMSIYHLGGVNRIPGTWPEQLLVQYNGLSFNQSTITSLTIAFSNAANNRTKSLTSLFWTTVATRATQHAIAVDFFAPRLTNDLPDMSDALAGLFGDI